MAVPRKPRGPKQAAGTGAPEPSPADEDKRQRQLSALSALVVEKRKENIDYRNSTGIEKIWAEDEDAYEGVDDANRNEHPSGLLSGGNKPGTGGIEPQKLLGCTLLPNITQPWVDGAAAKVADMLMPTDERNFVLEPSPNPDILDQEEGFAPAPVDQAILQRIQSEPPAFQRVALTAAMLDAKMARAKLGCDRTQTLIDDALSECQYQDEVRQAIDDASKAGTGVIKGPFAQKKTRRVRTRGPDGVVTEVIKEETVPSSRRIDYWNAFPGPGCGQNIQNGDSFWERDFLTRKQLIELAGAEGSAAYLDDQIAAVLKEGPQTRKAEAIGRRQTEELDEKAVFEIWYGYLTLSGDDLTALGCTCDDPLKSYAALVTVVNDRIIKAARNPLDSGAFPYDFLPWKRRKGMPWGQGIARQGRVAQRGYTAAYRNMMDNAGAAARPHTVSSGDLEQVDGNPWAWRFDPDQLGTFDVRAAMQFIVQPSLQQELTALMAKHEQMMEMHTGLSAMLLFGAEGNIQETKYGRALQNNNGATVLRRSARLFDGCLTEPHIGRYYEWLRQYSDDDEVAMGSFVVRARGSSALVERDIQNQFLPTIANMSLNPAFEFDPKLAGEQLLQSQRLDPSAFALTDERKKELLLQRQQMMQSAPPPWQVGVAQIRAQADAQIAQLTQQGESQRLQMQLAYDAQDSEQERAIKKMAVEIEGQLGAAKLSADQQQALMDVKATLAGLVMKLRADRGVASPGVVPHHGLPESNKPPIEIPGRAQNGLAFVQ